MDRKKQNLLNLVAKARVVDLFAGLYHSTFKGRGIEFEDLREYVPGDDVRAISWSKMAQLRRPFTKNFREERDLTVFFLVDLSASSNFATLSSSKREKMAEIVALLSHAAAANHDRVGLILFSSVVEKYVPPKRDKSHQARLLSELLSYTPQKKSTDLNSVLSFLVKVAKKKAICFLISDFRAPPFTRALEVAQSKHDVIAIHVADSAEKMLPPLGAARFQDMETGAIQEMVVDDALIATVSQQENERRKQVETALKHSRVDLIEIDTSRDAAPLLRAFFEQRKKRR